MAGRPAAVSAIGTLAQRMGVGRRTVQRRLQSLEDKKFLKSEWKPRENDESGRAVAHYDLTGVVERLRPFGEVAKDRRDARIRLRETPQGSLSEISCVRHNMTRRSMYAEQTEEGGYGRAGVAVDPEVLAPK